MHSFSGCWSNLHLTCRICRGDAVASFRAPVQTHHVAALPTVLPEGLRPCLWMGFPYRAREMPPRRTQKSAVQLRRGRCFSQGNQRCVFETVGKLRVPRYTVFNDPSLSIVRVSSLLLSLPRVAWPLSPPWGHECMKNDTPQKLTLDSRPVHIRPPEMTRVSQGSVFATYSHTKHYVSLTKRRYQRLDDFL